MKANTVIPRKAGKVNWFWQRKRQRQREKNNERERERESRMNYLHPIS